MATKRKIRKVKSLKNSKSKSRKSLGKFLKKKSLRKSKSRSRKYRKLRGGCENCTDYHGSGSPAPQWTQGSQTWFKGGSNEQTQMISNDIFKHSTDPSFYSSTN